jgi:mannosyltransferase
MQTVEAPRQAPANWATLGIISITLLAALLRFPTLAGQSLWWDEMATVNLVKEPLGQMLSTIADTENTPPLYYLLAWGWTHLFGTGDFGLRSLSAVFGVATVPVVYLLLKELVSARAGLVGALLTAVNPFLVYYSQEARSYALYALLGAVSLLFFVRVLKAPSRKSATWWAISCALALTAHYGASFLVCAEAVLLLVAHHRRIEIWWATGFLAAVAAALLPLAIHQRVQTGSAATWIGQQDLLERLWFVPKVFAFCGIASVPSLISVGKELVVGSLVVALALMFLRADPGDRRRGIIMFGLVLIALTLCILAAVSGVDVLFYRNLIALWFPAMAVFAIGLAARGAGALGAAAVAALAAAGIGMVLAIATNRNNQRSAWADAAAKLASTRASTAVVAAPLGRLDGELLERYGLAMEAVPPGVRMREVEVLYVRGGQPPTQIPGWVRLALHHKLRVATIENFQQFVLVRLRSRTALRLPRSELVTLPRRLFSCCKPNSHDPGPLVGFVLRSL